MSTLKERAKRIARGAERFALQSCAEWIRANGGAAAVAKKAEAAMPGVASLAAAWGASTNAAPAPQWREGATVAAAKAKAATVRAEKRGGRVAQLADEVREWAGRLWFDSDYRVGLEGKASSGGLVGLANQLAQVAGSLAPTSTEFRGTAVPRRSSAGLMTTCCSHMSEACVHEARHELGLV